MDWLSSNSMLLMEKSLDASWARQRLTLDNIANAETPGYKAKYATFEDELQQRLAEIQQGGDGSNQEIRDAIEGAQFQVHENPQESSRLDGNNVNIDVEQAELARNAYQYQFELRQVTDELTRLRIAIEGR